MPKWAEKSAYNLWVSNTYGISVTNAINVARPLWISDESIAPGMSVKVIGGNMSSAAYGVFNKSKATLVGDNGIYNLGLGDVNEFAIEVICPENIPAGEYDIYVTNDGVVWQKTENGQSITVTEKVNDVFNIGAAWVDGFNYDVEVNVKDYGAVPDDNIDDTAAIRKAIESLDEGGIVYIPEGVYDVSELVVGGRTILKGDGMDKTVLNCLGTSYTVYGFPVIKMENGFSGIYGLTIREKEGVLSPDEYLLMNNHSFLKEFKLDVPMVPDTEEGEGRGLGVVMVDTDEHVCVTDCEFIGYNAQPTHLNIGRYCNISDNTINTAAGTVCGVATYALFENNIIKRNGNLLSENDINVQGIFTRGPSYIANNMITDLGYDGCNDGEIICAENYLGGLKIAGRIVNSEADTVTIELFDDVVNEWDWNLLDAAYNKNYLVVTAGRGMGQYIPILDYSESKKTITVEKAFEVLPNKDSLFSVMPLSENVVMYNNYCENASKGYWLFSDCMDGVIANNTGINTEGALIWTIYKETETGYLNSAAYFNRIEDNYFDGHSTKSNIVGIGVLTAVEGRNPRTANIYGVEIKNNVIENAQDASGSVDINESAQINGISVCYPNWSGTTPYPLIKQVIIEGNVIRNSDTGISVTYLSKPGHNFVNSGDMTSEIFIGDNTFENVTTEITDTRK